MAPRVEGRLWLEAPAGRIERRSCAPNGPSWRRCGSVERGELSPRVRIVRHERARRSASSSSTWLHGGNYYAIVEPQAAWPGLDGMSAPGHPAALSPAVREAVPSERVAAGASGGPSASFGVSHVMWCDSAHARAAPMRATRCFTAEVGVYRSGSPCGTGSVGADGAAGAKGCALGGRRGFVHESILSARGSVVRRSSSKATVGDRDAIRPSVAGWARITGHNTITVDDRDPLAYGFQLA